MKKLMTMLAAVGTAFGLFAADEGAFISGTAFETETGDNISWTVADQFKTTFWSGTGDSITTVAAGTHGTIGTNQRPEDFAESDNNNVLNIKTTLGNPVSLGVQPNAGTQDAPVLFDGLVNLTVFDAGDDAVPATDLTNAKIACYLQAVDDDGTATNFVVRAANEPTGGWVCAPNAAIEPGWHRLTIKAIPVTSNQMGFVIFIDGDNLEGTADVVVCDDAIIDNTDGFSFEAKKWNKTGSLFLSKAAGTAISAVAFDGQGSVDDLAFTTKVPAFAAGVDGYYVSFDATKIAIEIDGTEYTESPVEIQAAPGTINIKWTALDGSILSNTDGKEFSVISGGTIEITDFDLDTSAASFNGVGYETVEAACDAAAIATADGEMKIFDGTDAAIELLGDFAVTVDLNGQTVGAANASNGITLTNSNTSADAVVNGASYGDPLNIASSNIKIIYEDNESLEAELIGDALGQELAHVGDYWVVQPIPTYTVTFVVEGVSTPIANVKKGTAFDEIPGKPADPVVSGKVFTGWANAPETITADVTVTALFNTIVEVQPTAIMGLTYNKAAQTGVAEDTGFTVANGTQTDAGEYTATATLTTGYCWDDQGNTADKQIAWSIAKADAIITTDPTADAEIEEGAQLNTINLVGGVANVDGSFAWTEPETAVKESGNFSVTFTPTDSTNYKTATCEVAVTVKAGETPIKPGDEQSFTPTDPSKAADEAAAKFTIQAADAAAEAAGQKAVLKQVVTPVGGGTYKVTVAIDEDAEAFVEPDKANEIVGAALAEIAAGTATTVTIPAASFTPGLYYSVVGCGELGFAEAAEGDRVLATGESISLPVPAVTGDKAFFKVVESMTAKPANED